MSRKSNNSHWIGRLIGGLIVCGAAFASLRFWNTWELSLAICLLISVMPGLLFVLFGGNIWSWVNSIDDWS